MSFPLSMSNTKLMSSCPSARKPLLPECIPSTWSPRPETCECLSYLVTPSSQALAKFSKSKRCGPESQQSPTFSPPLGF